MWNCGYKWTEFHKPNEPAILVQVKIWYIIHMQLKVKSHWAHIIASIAKYMCVWYKCIIQNNNPEVKCTYGQNYVSPKLTQGLPNVQCACIWNQGLYGGN